MPVLAGCIRGSCVYRPERPEWGDRVRVGKVRRGRLSGSGWSIRVNQAKTIGFPEEAEMKIPNKLVDDVITQIAGEHGVSLVNSFKNKKNTSEFIIAEKTGFEINTTRNILYKLYHANMVSFTRKKDKQKGWYIYYWTFKPKRIKDILISLKKKRLEKLQEQLHRENASFFFRCSANCMRLNFDQAVDFNYKCPECGSLMEQENSDAKKAQIKQEIEELIKSLSVFGVKGKEPDKSLKNIKVPKKH